MKWRFYSQVKTEWLAWPWMISFWWTDFCKKGEFRVQSNFKENFYSFCSVMCFIVELQWSHMLWKQNECLQVEQTVVWKIWWNVESPIKTQRPNKTCMRHREEKWCHHHPISPSVCVAVYVTCLRPPSNCSLLVHYYGNQLLLMCCWLASKESDEGENRVHDDDNYDGGVTDDDEDENEYMMKMRMMMTAIFHNPESKTCLNNHNDDETSKGLQAGASWHMVLALGLLTDVPWYCL